MTDLTNSAPLAVRTIPIAASDMRGLIGGLFSTPGLVTLSSTVAGATVTQADTPAMSVLVKPFAVVIANSGTTAAFQNKGYLSNEDTLTLTVASAPGSGSRTDLVVARVYDTDFGGASSKATVEVLTGTTVAPAGAVELARIVVTAGMTSVTSANITVTEQRATLNGTPLYLAEESSLPSPSTLPSGTRAYCNDYMSEWVVKSGSWALLVAPEQAGYASADKTLNTTLANVPGMSCPVAPNGLYEVVANVYATAGSSSDVSVAFASPSGSGFVGSLEAVVAPNQSMTTATSTQVRMQAFAPTTLPFGTDGTAVSFARLSGLLSVAATPGTVDLQAALGSAGTGSVKAGSYLRVTRIG